MGNAFQHVKTLPERDETYSGSYYNGLHLLAYWIYFIMMDFILLLFYWDF